MKEKMKIDVFNPQDCSEYDICAFHVLVVEGSKVEPGGLEERIRRAYRLAFYRIVDDIVSVAAIKYPRKNYTNRVFRNASAGIGPETYTLEYGWAFTKAGHGSRGYASATASALLRNLETPVFATTQSNNVAMQLILEKNSGREDLLVLYVRQT
jgi:hypothetical protein